MKTGKIPPKPAQNRKMIRDSRKQILSLVVVEDETLYNCTKKSKIYRVCGIFQLPMVDRVCHISA